MDGRATKTELWTGRKIMSNGKVEPSSFASGRPLHIKTNFIIDSRCCLKLRTESQDSAQVRHTRRPLTRSVDGQIGAGIPAGRVAAVDDTVATGRWGPHFD